MSRLIARKGDGSSHGATIFFTNQDGTVFCEGKEVAVEGAKLNSHYSDPVHVTPEIHNNLASKLFVNGKKVVLNGSIADCNAVVEAGSVKTYGE